MQYLSRAYNYYSGINPATLTGAIDVIAIRHVGLDGEVTLSASPFHVRFGKLQVIRAGEKRVTLRLPNNLPAPHVAPFSMKVGETGEAFFVLETADTVPEELMTSPVVMPSEGESVGPDLQNHTQQQDEDLSGHNPSLTQQPFGDTEKPLSHDGTLPDVEFLDLNAPARKGDTKEGDPDERESISTPSSMLDAAASLLPSIPFISETSTQESDQPDAHDEVRLEKPSQSSDSPIITPSQPPVPPNPIAAKPGEDAGLPARDEHLSTVASPPMQRSGDPSDALPRVPPGEGDGPRVIQGTDIVLDAMGYHSPGGTAIDIERGSNDRGGQHVASEVHDTVLNTFTRDLEAALSSHHRPPLHLRSTDPDVQLQTASLAFASNPDLPLASSPPTSPGRGDRATSEPPPDLAAPVSPRLDHSSAALAMDYAWDWGRMPPEADANEVSPGPVRRGTLPALDLGANDHPAMHIKGVDENPYLLVLEMDGRSHTFELALCAAIIDDPSIQSTQRRESAFIENRITFQRFIDEPELVDDPALVLRYSLQYLTWANDNRMLRTLALYRHSLGSIEGGYTTLPSLGDLGVEPPQSSGYAWSRWWRRSNSPSSPSSNPTDNVTEKPMAELEHQSSPTPAKHYAKTLRLSSDQLKLLQLKPGPNTVQFSVTSSYSGVAVCSARIFLWESTDQVVISDIDGTITKSDALGHVYAAIGRDWTHSGIAKLYTDITNNGYRMLYLTSRAIGQADSTRGYLKSIAQGDYRLPEGPVIMSPDRLMASLHREVIMRKPELFKMACLRDIQRLFAEHAQEAFFAGFGNRITDAMSYRSVGIEAAKIYTIDSTGVVKSELLQAAGHKASYIQLNDLVNEVFPPMSTKFKPEFTDFNFWRSSIADVELPDMSPPSPALSARSDSSSRYSVFGKITSLGRRSSRQPILPTSNPSSRPSSPLMGPSFSADDLSEPDSPNSSMPGSFEKDKGSHFPNTLGHGSDLEIGKNAIDDQEGYDYDDDDNFDDDLLATGEMRNVPF